MNYKILWPRECVVGPEKIKEIFFDCVANGEIDDVDDHDDVDLMAKMLHEDGAITLAAEGGSSQ